MSGRPDAVALYVRVSTDDQALRETIKLQLDVLRGHCQVHGLVVAGVYSDDGISGTVPLIDRPDGKRLMADAADGRFRRVLFYRLDRFGRKMRVILDGYEGLDALGVGIESLSEKFDTTTPFGRAMFQFLGIIAELERSTIVDRMTGGRDRDVRAGKYTGGPIPFGYDLDDDRYYIPSERWVEQAGMTEADLVRDVYDQIAFHQSSLNAQRLRLTALGVPCRKRYGTPQKKSKARPEKAHVPSATWATSTVEGILHNPLYKGAATFDAARGPIDRPSPGLVPAETWDLVQIRLQQNQKSAARNAKVEYLLRGLVRCAACGYSYSGATKGGTRTYRCISDGAGAPGARCYAGAVNADRLERTVWAAVKDFVERPDEYIREAQGKLRERLADTAGRADELRALTRELAAKDEDRERVLDLYRRGRTNADECDRDLDKVAAEARELRERLDRLKGEADMASASEAYLSDVATALATARERVAQIEAADDRREMRALIELLAPSLVLHTDVLGVVKVRQRKAVTLELTLAFRPETVIVPVTAIPDGGNYPESALLVATRSFPLSA